jgi:TetR/AcrR family transcriptional regulator, repressor for uid operon
MRRPDFQLQADRRGEILAAASRCFVRTGFHRTSMQDICAEAGMSPGGLYRYFPSKEALIAGIAERDRAQLQAALQSLDQAPDFFSAFRAIGYQLLIERPIEEIGVWAEIISESRRSPQIAELYAACDRTCREQMVTALRHAASRGEVRTDLDFENVIQMMFSIGDGLCWRRIVDPTFDAARVFAMATDMIRNMLQPAGSLAGADPASVAMVPA